MIIAAHPIPEAKALNVPLADLVNDVIGGSFTARINMNLREDKGWSYGARSFVLSTLGPQVFGVSTGVQTDKTAESIVEIDRELREYLTTRPPTADELEKAKASRTLKLPGRNETTSGLLSSLNEIALFGYSDDYFETYAKDVSASSVDDLIKLAPTLIQPDKLLWVVVGDRATIEAKIKELGLGEVKVMELPE
jgi:zinc protease